MKRSLVISLTLVVAITVIFLAATLAGGWSPKLGLDLAGGSEIVYKPARTITAGELQTTINVIRNRVDAAGVSGANVNSQGGNVVVQLPGLKDPQKVIRLIGQTAQLQFRPVLCAAAPYTPPKKGTKLPALPSACSASQYSLLAPNLTVTPDNSAQGYSTNQNSIGDDPALAAYKTTTPAYDDAHPHSPVLVPLSGGGGLRYLLGPSELSGTAIA